MSRRALGGLCLVAAGLFACDADSSAGDAAAPEPATDATPAGPDIDADTVDAAELVDAGPRADATPEADAGVDPCRDAPFETYETFGRGFLATWCAGCHAATSLERFGAPLDVTFDTRAEAVAWGERILARAAVDPATMPPAGGSSLLDRERLRIWLTCFETAPGAAPR